MGKIAAILGPSGDGKTTSLIVNPDGSVNLSKDGYKGMDPKTHVIINLDMKELPFPAGMWSEENKNLITTNDAKTIKDALTWIANQKEIKSVSLDTINLYLAYKEYNERKKLTFDQWRDIASDVIEINMLCNTILRPDQIAYIMGHTELVTDVNGREKKAFSVIGKKSKRQPPESFYPICLFTNVDCDGEGKNTYSFETQANFSSAKSPIGMFKDFLIPNSLKLVDDTIRAYYKI